MNLARYVIAFVSLSFLINHSKAQSVEEVLNRLENVNRSHSVISYDFDLYRKLLFKEDTTLFSGKASLRRSLKDTIALGEFWIDVYGKGISYYDLEYFYKTNPEEKKILQYDLNKYGVWPLGGMIGQIRKIGFLDPEKFNSLLEGSDSHLDIAENHFIITLGFPDDGDFKGMRYKIWIHKDLYIVERMEFRVSYFDDFQYTEWNLKNIEFQEENYKKSTDRFMDLLDSYNLEHYRPKEEDKELETDGTVKAPIFKGFDYIKNEEVSFSDFNEKIIILEFTYMGCYPCIKSIPALNDIQEKYKNNDIVLLAFNGVDNNDQRIKKLPDYINNHQIKFPVIIGEKEVLGLYRISSYPTIYVIDKKGMIVGLHIGYSEDLLGDLTEKINALLNHTYSQ